MSSIFKNHKKVHIVCLGLFMIAMVCSSIAIVLTSKWYLELWNIVLVAVDGVMSGFHMIKLSQTIQMEKEFKKLLVQSLMSKPED